MRKGIVLKLFLLTTVLCMLILATIFIGQTIFFKQYYADRKVNDIKANINSFEREYLNHVGNVEAMQKLEQDFSKKNNIWITTLDRYGNLKNANDFYVEVKLNEFSQNKLGKVTVTIPLYNLLKIDEIENEKLRSTSGTKVYLSGIEKDDIFIPASVSMADGNLNWTNKPLDKKMSETALEIKKGNIKDKGDLYTTFAGSIVKFQSPANIALGNPIYINDLFMESIREFQAELLLNGAEQTYNFLQIIDYEKNDIKYKLLIKQIQEKDGSFTYIFTMASLQPVDEAIQMVKDYYIYFIGFVVVLILLASFYYSKQIAKPLLRINDRTKQIAQLDFTERIPITSKDEIGELSNNINILSNKVHTHIEQLEQDIEKERKLENTRKEFISGVSHELKTPLSIMKSCISILKDGVAEHKKEYYFQAMEKEVDKMDMLILDMLELAKFESGTYKMKIDTFYIDGVIEHICAQLLLEIEKKELHVYKNISPTQVIANQLRIEQVIVNFITNAIRYTPNKEDIIISTIDEPNRVKICIENKGAHIEEDQLDKIWDRFYRVDTARQRSQGGTGLGLAISKNILELHEAEYGVNNTVDGVLFHFYLPKKV
ncbi:MULTISPECIES: sensor histidine kinase [Bacillus cereus group]|uniref:sensor histidine kinase n=1 Tax=Bacillus cereus group TaxID=86661 RepID=UPI000BECE09B|nr:MULTISPECIES: HAMP domain-containing sensor histidine kinase [Bacillus cereus group]MED3526252.1 HAMP domain-containing sensor histidine kinase [Bacillus thuringiensis]PEE98250.1 two-component sensor histidine kinase [Bacillus thuringiensis]PEL83009.1 two-component sensor histidine kinase [Bacillus wiedmannii]PEV09166.1 two-component sensor histidine kinase [Bacillus thuringiensis]PFV51749.1 two-component sensor histidine kinase [Bacillus thuringiensis]